MKLGAHSHLPYHNVTGQVLKLTGMTHRNAVDIVEKHSLVVPVEHY